MGFESDDLYLAYRPDTERREAHVVNLGYVINVIEDLAVRQETLRSAWRLARTVLAVAARIAVDGSGECHFRLETEPLLRFGWLSGC